MFSGAANQFGFVNARIRGMMSRFLRLDTYESLLQSASYEEFIKMLANTYYGPIISKAHPSGIPTPDELALILSGNYAEVSHNLTKSLSGKVNDFASTYMKMFLAESIKSMIRGIHVGLDKDEILRFAVPTSPEEADEFAQLAEARSVQIFVDELPYWDLKISLLTKMPVYEELSSTAPLEVAIESWYLRNLMKILKDFPKEDQKRVLDIVEARVDLRNVLTMLRALALQLDSRAIDLSLVEFTGRSKALLESIRSKPNWREVITALESTRYGELAGRIARMYEESQSLVTVELAIEDYIAQRVKQQMTAYPFHLGIIFAFFTLKFYEVRNIQVISVGIERNHKTDEIRNMLTYTGI
ncbi:MAG: V-type ATPase subunit [Candidatus Thorarchaeota archaeon]|nr:V-type ATPase subunit [Candidatus Thorarchaeota archaeon]